MSSFWVQFQNFKLHRSTESPREHIDFTKDVAYQMMAINFKVEID